MNRCWETIGVDNEECGGSYSPLPLEGDVMVSHSVDPQQGVWTSLRGPQNLLGQH